MAGVAWAVYTIRREIRLEAKKQQAKQELLRHEATPVWVDLARCEIVTSALNPDQTNQDGNDTYSVLKFMYEGKPYYSGNIYKDEDAHPPEDGTAKTDHALHQSQRLRILPRYGLSGRIAACPT